MSVQDQVSKSLKLVGRVLGDKFKLTACIGIGGSGAVYRADQIALGRTVAVKILNEDLSADSRMINRFRAEAMAASRLNNPNTVSIIDYGQASDGLLYLAMEYVRGPTLTQLLVNEAPLDIDRVLDICSQMLVGIEEAHLAGVVHADLKSDNIILDQRRAGVDVVKIVDFGIARLVTGPREGDDRSISGTPEYMAPEVIGGAPPSFASDIYAVGIILYELLAYKTPFFAGSTTEILANHLKAIPVSLSSRREAVPMDLDALVAEVAREAPDRSLHVGVGDARRAHRDSREAARHAGDRSLRDLSDAVSAEVQVLPRGAARRACASARRSRSRRRKRPPRRRCRWCSPAARTSSRRCSRTCAARRNPRRRRPSPARSSRASA